MDCPFCKITEVCASSEMSVAFYDAFPVSPGHVLVVPRRHVSSYFDLTETEQKDLWMLVSRTKDILDEKYSPDGYNIGINVGKDAGQSVFHVHVHVIPRYHGDVEDPKGGVRGVIPSMQKY